MAAESQECGQDTVVLPCPMRVALTGGMGSGKSSATRRFQQHGIRTLDADQVSRQIMQPGTPAYKKLLSQFGDDYLHHDQQINRAKLREQIFTDPKAKARLEAIVHPAILTAIDDWLTHATGPYVVVEVPLLAEVKQAERYDRILVIDCPETLQIKRIMERDSRSKADAQAMLAHQVTRAERLQLADDVMDNQGSLDELYQGIDRLHEYYLALTLRPANKQEVESAP